MSLLHDLAEKVRRDDPIPAPLAGLLSAATPLTRLGMRFRLARPRVRVPARVISFGNLTAGGTGKTPAVIERARAEAAAGGRVAVLTRGYRGASRARVLVADPAQDLDRIATDFGDEPALILARVPGVELVKAADRIAGARVAVEERHCDTLVLDDGFQYVPLERDENVLLIDATNPFGNGRLIPRGLLREPVSAIARATHVILTRCDQAANVAPLLDRIHTLAPGIPVRTTRHAPVVLRRPADGVELPLEHLRGLEVNAACAIGRPEAFFRTLEGLGADVVERRAFPDHVMFDAAVFAPSRPLLVTEKDAVRLRTPPENVLALVVELRDVSCEMNSEC